MYFYFQSHARRRRVLKYPRKEGYLYTLLLVVAILLSYTNTSFAFSVLPNRAEVFVEAGGKYSGEYTILNTDAASIEINIFADRWVIQEGRDATPWIKVWPGRVNIPANSSKKVKYTVKTPKGVEGEYTSSIVFRSALPEGVGAGMDAVMQLRIATYVVIKGTEGVR